MEGDKAHQKAAAAKALTKATKEWRAAKKKERAARDALAEVVVSTVKSGVLNENKVAQVTDIPRMTIRKMLGKP
jgi:DNA invertase Pin-like site-specific DNA recombinase